MKSNAQSNSIIKGDLSLIKEMVSDKATKWTSISSQQINKTQIPYYYQKVRL